MSRSIKNKLKKIKLLLLDVDGVLTDGSIIYDDNNVETKKFNVKDGLGLRLLMDSGVKVGIVTGRVSSSLKHRCNNLGIKTLFEGIHDKAEALEKIMHQTGVDAEGIAFVGDDLPDIAIMNRVGFSVAVADAHENVREKADMVTSAKGGRGAVREICEAILKAGGKWEVILSRYQ
jgi:3-deoxy-D-manno-octulosonate 8-phosphate phosphatase (KDO 8-P phosphatase)